MRVLCLDSEGGHGGSSRSLFELLRGLKRSGEDLEIKVLTLRGGVILERYEAIGIRADQSLPLPRLTAVGRASRQLISHGRFLRDWNRTTAGRESLLAEVAQADVVHLNHESFADLGGWIARKTGVPVTCHIRTRPPAGWAARRQAAVLAATCRELVFITENESDHFRSLGGNDVRSTILYNACPTYDMSGAPGCTSKDEFRVAVLGNFSLVRGSHLLPQIAKAVRDQSGMRLTFVVAGDGNITHSERRRIGTDATTLGQLVEEVGVAECFEIHGHVSNPEQVVQETDCLLRPSVEGNPWGRDVLEALALGRAVVAAGTYDRFVEDGVTGRLVPDAEPSTFAAALLDLADNPERVAALGQAGRERVRELCDPVRQGKKLSQVWRRAVDG